MEPTDNLMAFVERKLFTLNTGHIVTATSASSGAIWHHPRGDRGSADPQQGALRHGGEREPCW